MKPRKNEDSISEILHDSERVRKIIQGAINDALLKHKLAGNPVCELQNGKVVWVQPQNIVIRK